MIQRYPLFFKVHPHDGDGDDDDEDEDDDDDDGDDNVVDYTRG